MIFSQSGALDGNCVRYVSCLSLLTNLMCLELLQQSHCHLRIGQLESGPMGVKLKPPMNGKPYFLVRSSLSSLINEYENSKTATKIFLYIFGGLGVFISGWMAWKYFKKVKREQEQNRLRDTLSNIRTERTAITETVNIENLPDTRTEID